jgi:hypothetical protein
VLGEPSPLNKIPTDGTGANPTPPKRGALAEPSVVGDLLSAFVGGQPDSSASYLDGNPWLKN